ncbi:MAG: hypothetical protein K9M11_02850 [Candidatus Pacebacteria bacterium]|nr:hypothetical protein [Candidatus Paceibacterota bacterium]
MTKEFGQQKKTIEILSKLGLNEGERNVYLYGIKMPPIPVSTLAKHVGITRPNAYNILALLQEKGLCWNLGAQYGRKIMFAPPEKILTLYQKKLTELTALEDEVKKMSTSLKDKKYTGPIVQPRVQYFQGVEGVKKLYFDSLTTKEKLIRTAVYKGTNERLGRAFTDDYIRHRYGAGIKNVLLYAKSMAEFNKDYEHDPTFNRDVRVPPKTVNFDSTIMIYDSRVAIITMSDDMFGTLIESVDFSNTMKGWFDTIWNNSKG